MSRYLFAILIASFLLTTPTIAQQEKSGGNPKPPVEGVVNFALDLPVYSLRVDSQPVPGSDVDLFVSVDLDLEEPVIHPVVPGEPRLPQVTRLVVLPSGAEVSDVTVEKGVAIEIENVALVQWAEIARAGQQGKRDPIPPTFSVVGNEIVFYAAEDGTAPVSDYLERTNWPEKTVNWRPSGAGGKAARILQLDISPVEWLPEQGVLLFYPQQDITVEYTLPKSQPPIKPVLADVLTVDTLRNQVVNPELLPDFELPHIQTVDAPYLIITDNYEWSEEGVRGAPITGDAVTQLQRLADWKQQNGFRSRVVTVTDIVSGRYGNFSTGAADLQETIRNFLKHARQKWNTYWVLLGGAAEIIPPRVVLANANANIGHAILLKDKETPDTGRAYWDPDESVVRIHVDGIGSGETLYSMRDGAEFTYVGWPTSRDPGWGYATDETYRAPSFVPTEYVVLSGLPEDVPASIHRALEENMIPTDLYYASVDDPLYDVPGQKDWDANGNGIYGQHGWDGQVDGVSLDPDLAVGRAPFKTGEEAEQWVDRTLTYEKYEMDEGFAEKLLLIGDNWGAGGEPARYVPPFVDLESGRAHVFTDPEEFSEAKIFFYGPVTFFEKVINPEDWFLVYQIGDSFFSLPYNRNASPTSGGYYFTADESFGPPSETAFEFLGFTFYIQSPTRFVKAFGPFEATSTVSFFFDNFEPDGVIEHKENVAEVLSTAAPSITEVRRLYKDWYDFPGGPDPSMKLTDAQVQNQFGGNNLVSIAGHGAPQGCCEVTAYRPPLPPFSGVVYADSCLTARFAVTGFRSSLAEALTVANARGAVAYVGNSAYSWIGTGNDIEKVFWSELGRNTTLAALHHTKATFRNWSTLIWANYSLTLFGDPSLKVWRSSPTELNVEFPETISPGTSLRVRVTSAEGEPLQFLRVTMTGRNIFENEISDLDGWVEFRPVVSPGEMTVAVAASGYVPFEGSVSVEP